QPAPQPGLHRRLGLRLLLLTGQAGQRQTQGPCPVRGGRAAEIRRQAQERFLVGRGQAPAPALGQQGPPPRLRRRQRPPACQQRRGLGEKRRHGRRRPSAHPFQRL